MIRDKKKDKNFPKEGGDENLRQFPGTMLMEVGKRTGGKIGKGLV